MNAENYHEMLKILRQIKKLEQSNTAIVHPRQFFRIQENIAHLILKLEKKIPRIRRRKGLSEKQVKLLIKGIDYDISLVRLWGDKLAWSILSHFTIRQHTKHPPISRPQTKTRGFKAEMRAGKYLSRYSFVLMHSVTNCLRVGDITAYGLGGTKVYEVKASFRPTKDRIEKLNKQIRKIGKLESVQKNIDELVDDELFDRADGEFDPRNVLKSSPPEGWEPRPEKTTFVEDIEKLLKKALRYGGDDFFTFDNITGYFIGSADIRTVSNMLRRGPVLSPKQKEFMSCSGTFTTIDIFERPNNFDADIPPVTDLFSPEIAVKLIKGDLVVITLISGNRLRDYLKSRGIEVETSEDQLFLKTHRYKIDGKTAFLFYPLRHMMFAVHTAEYLANWCLDNHEFHKNTMEKVRQRYPDATIVEYGI